jgi:UDP-glucose 4-epimerase
MNRLNPLRVLVTGPTGFLGSALCALLLSDGCEVHGLCRPGAAALAPGVTRWEVPLDDDGALSRLMGVVRPDTVFHLAGFTSASRELSAVVPSFEANLVSTVHLLTAVSNTDCRRVVLAGSLEQPQAIGATPSSPYAASKSAATAYAQMFWQLFRTPVTVARIYMVYGPAQQDLKKLIPYTILSLLQGAPPQFTSGTRSVDWVFVDDVVRGLIDLSKAEGVEGSVVDLGTGVGTSVREVVETIAALMESRMALTFGEMPERPDEQIRLADAARTEALLGWKPRVALRDGLTQTIAYYRSILSIQA